MQRNVIIGWMVLLLFLAVSCAKDEETDMQKPVIDLTMDGAFPGNCDTLYFGEPFTLKVLFSDNKELGSYSFDVHHNFDHHSHSTEVTVCTYDPDKAPVNPFLLIQDGEIPDGMTMFETNLTVSVPSGNGNGSFDDGDYHFFISLTDKEGWSTQKGLSIKMLHR